jgi:hypothetical protein
MSRNAGWIFPDMCVNEGGFRGYGGSYLGIGPDILEHACNSAK